MKIYRKVVTDIETGERLHEDSFEYDGPVTQCNIFGYGSQKSGGTQAGTSAQFGTGTSTQTSRATSRSDPSAALVPASQGILSQVGGVAQEFFGQMLEMLQTGGVGAQAPIISRALESSKQATSTAMRQTEEGLAQRGLAGTPFGERILAGQRATGAAETSRVPTDIATAFMSLIPQAIGGAQQTGISGLAAGRTEQASSTMDALSTWLNQAVSQSTGQQKAAGSNVSCCFIFLAGAGQLSSSVRRYRDSHMTMRNRRGYYWLADRLVPLMERSRAIKYLVNLLMVRPMTYYGDYYYNKDPIGFIFAPITQFWLIVFTFLGYRSLYCRRGTEEVV